MYRCTSPHSCYLGNEKISFPLTVDYCEFKARYSENNESLAFEFEDLFTKDKPAAIRQKDNYYIFHKKDRHFHISQRYIKGKMIQTVRFEFLSAIVNGKPIIFEEILEVTTFLEEVDLFKKYNKILKQHNCEWPDCWDNREYASYNVQRLKEEAYPKPKQITPKAPPKTLTIGQAFDSDVVDVFTLIKQMKSVNISEPKEKPTEITRDRICLMVKHLGTFVWVDDKDALIMFINNLLHSRYTEKDIVIEPCRFNPCLGKNTHSVIIAQFGLLGFINRAV